MRPALRVARRYHEFLFWLPVSAALTVAAWVVLGALDRTAGLDVLSQLTALPVKAAYAIAAIAGMQLIRRRWHYPLSEDQKLAYWTCLMAGAKGPIIVFITDAVLTLTCIAFLLYFFSY